MYHLTEQHPVLAYPQRLQAALARKRARQFAKLLEGETLLALTFFLTEEELSRLALTCRVARARTSSSLLISIRLA
jgi:hypothetical protein